MNWRRIGKLVKTKTGWQVYCAACDRGKACDCSTAFRGVITTSLRQIGWSDKIDGRWRCDNCHSNVSKLMPEQK
jgi:hypothetical protein